MADENLLSNSIQSLFNEDTTGLRNKYYSFLDQGLNAASTPAQPDDNALLLRGILPTIAAALFTKGKGLQFAGAPLTNVLETEEKRAQDRQKFDIDTSLKKAGLIGDVLEKKDKAVLDEFQRVEQAQLRREEGAANRALREDIANQGHLDRMSIAGMVNADRDASRGMRDEKDTLTRKRQLQDSFRKDLKDRKVVDQLSQAASIREALSGGTALSDAQIPTMLVTLRGDVGNKAIAEQKSALPPTVYSEVQKLHNWISNGAQGTIPTQQKEAIIKLVDIYENQAKRKIGSLRDEYKKYYGDDEKELIDTLGSSLDSGSAAPPQNRLQQAMGMAQQLQAQIAELKAQKK